MWQLEIGRARYRIRTSYKQFKKITPIIARIPVSKKRWFRLSIYSVSAPYLKIYKQMVFNWKKKKMSNIDFHAITAIEITRFGIFFFLSNDILLGVLVFKIRINTISFGERIVHCDVFFFIFFVDFILITFSFSPHQVFVILLRDTLF